MTADERDTAFEMAVAAVRYGPGVTREVGMDLADRHLHRTLIVTDPVVARLPPAQAVVDSLDANNVQWVMYDRVRVEPTDESWLDAIAFARDQEFDAKWRSAEDRRSTRRTPSTCTRCIRRLISSTTSTRGGGIGRPRHPVSRRRIVHGDSVHGSPSSIASVGACSLPGREPDQRRVVAASDAHGRRASHRGCREP